MVIEFVLKIYLDGIDQTRRGFTHLEDAVTCAKKDMEFAEKSGHPFFSVKGDPKGDLVWGNSEHAEFRISKSKY
jgi:hypothetical protein